MKGFNEHPGLRIKVEKIVLGIRFFKVNKKSRNARKEEIVRSQGITNKTEDNEMKMLKWIMNRAGKNNTDVWGYATLGMHIQK